jgi:hypothetical protein
MLLKSIEQEEKDIIKKKNIGTGSNNQVHNNIIGNIIIAVAGTSRGVGCTHTAIAIANYIARNGHKVALIEKNSNRHFAQLYDMNYDRGLLNTFFSIDGVDYYPNNYKDLASILSAGYKYIIMDLSVLIYADNKGKAVNYDNFLEMQRANKQILVGGIKEWQLNDFMFTLGGEESLNWNLYITFTDKDMFKQFKNEVDRNVFFAPFCPDPSKVYDEQDFVINEIIGDILPVSTKVIKRRLFR